MKKSGRDGPDRGDTGRRRRRPNHVDQTASYQIVTITVSPIRLRSNRRKGYVALKKLKASMHCTIIFISFKDGKKETCWEKFSLVDRQL